MSRYAEAAAEVTGNTTIDARMCDAVGCPLPGTIGDATNGPTRWYCRVHHGCDRSEEAAITAHIANRRRPYVLAFRLMNAPTACPIPDEVADWLAKEGRADILAAFAGRNADHLTARQLGAAMLTILDRECREPQQRIPQTDQPAPKAKTWQLGRELLEGLQ